MSSTLDAILSFAICFATCGECIESIDKNGYNSNNKNNKNNSNEYHEINENNENNENKLYRLSCEYQLSDERLIRNRDGNAICSWCNEIITDNNTILVQCVSCEKLMGHPFCFKQNKICLYCIM